MRIIDVKQGTPEWLIARLGIPTASNFDRIVTKTGKASAQADEYIARLAAEWFLGQSLDEDATEFMQRGIDLEPEAVRFYEFSKDVLTTECGLCITDDGRAGASPDRLVDDDGLLEIKCPAAVTHMGYVIGGITDKYKVQTQGQLWVTGRAWVDLLSYHPTLPRATVRFERDEKFIALLEEEVGKFAERLAAVMVNLTDRNAEHERAREMAAETSDHDF